MPACSAEHVATLLWGIRGKITEEILAILHTLFPGELEDAIASICDGRFSATDEGEGMSCLTMENPSVRCSLPVPYCSCPTFHRSLRARGRESPTAVCAHILAFILIQCSRSGPGGQRELISVCVKLETSPAGARDHLFDQDR